MPPLTYANYLDLEKLLTLQRPRSTPPEHDEMLFIIIHQTYELWFKQLLHEFEKIKTDFSAGDLFGAIHSFKRVRTIMKVLVAQIDILETMTPTSFSSFRDRLETASGFQSIQFREIEFVLGYKRESTLKYVKPDFPGADRLQERIDERTVIEHFYDFLEKRGARISAELKNRDVTEPNGPNYSVQQERPTPNAEVRRLNLEAKNPGTHESGTHESRNGISEIEGNAARVAAKERGERLSFKAGSEGSISGTFPFPCFLVS